MIGTSEKVYTSDCPEFCVPADCRYRTGGTGELITGPCQCIEDNVSYCSKYAVNKHPTFEEAHPAWRYEKYLNEILSLLLLFSGIVSCCAVRRLEAVKAKAKMEREEEEVELITVG